MAIRAVGNREGSEWRSEQAITGGKKEGVKTSDGGKVESTAEPIKRKNER